jgi:hypothetical protein
MKDIDASVNWVMSEVWCESGFEFKPEKIGNHRPMFRVERSGSLASLFLEPRFAPPPWRRLAGESYTESFFSQLLPLMEEERPLWLYICYPDGTWAECCWVKAVEASNWNADVLFTFERERASQRGASELCVLFEDRKGLIMLSLSDGFSIDYYGSNERWERIVMDLGIANNNVGDRGK